MRLEPLRGHCLCGAVAYEVTAAPLDAGYCHCGVCRRASGAPVVAWGTVPKASLEFTRGTPGTYASSPRALRRFCRDCGTALTFEYVPASDTIDFTLASLEDPGKLAPQYHIWTASQVPWLRMGDELPRHEGRGPDLWT